MSNVIDYGPKSKPIREADRASRAGPAARTAPDGPPAPALLPVKLRPGRQPPNGVGNGV